MPRNDFAKLDGAYCPDKLEALDWQSSAVAYAELQTYCKADDHACWESAGSGTSCKKVPGFWCYWTWDHYADGIKGGPSYCGANKSDCEGMRTGAVRRTNPDGPGRIATSDRCYFIKL